MDNSNILDKQYNVTGMEQKVLVLPLTAGSQLFLKPSKRT